MVASPTQVPPDAATRIPDDVTTVFRIPTPFAISNLPNRALSMAPAETMRPHRSPGRGVVAGVSFGAVALAGLAFALFRRTTPTAEPALAVATRSPVAVVPPTMATATAPDVVASEPAQPAPVSVIASAPPSIPATAATAAATVAAKPRARLNFSPVLVPDPPPRPAAGSTEDDPPPAASGELARRLAGEVDRDLANCRCGAAGRLMDKLAAAPRGASLAATRKAKVTACRPVDIDHRCVQGRLVEAE